jgi:Na+/melibiose symporter-like transporter
VGLAFTLVRLVDIGFDPLAGGLMDGTRTRFGRFRVWLVASVPILMLAAWRLFMATPGVGVFFLWAWLAVAYVGFSMGSLSQTAWAAELSPDYDQRSRIYGWWQTGNVLGMILVLLLPPILSLGFGLGEAQGVHAMGWFIIVLLPLTVSLACWRVGEPLTQAPPERGRVSDYFALMRRPSIGRLVLTDLLLGWAPGVTGILYLFYFDQIKHAPAGEANVLLLLFFLSGLVFGPVWSGLAGRIGKHRALAAAALTMVAGELVVLMTPFSSIYVAGAVMAFAGTSYSGPLLLRAMMADASDELRLETGRDQTGLLYALLTATTKIGTALAGLSFVVLDLAGFHRGGGNGPTALFWLQAMFIGAPALLSALAAWLIMGHRLDAKRHAEILAALALRAASPVTTTAAAAE